MLHWAGFTFVLLNKFTTSREVNVQKAAYCLLFSAGLPTAGSQLNSALVFSRIQTTVFLLQPKMRDQS